MQHDTRIERSRDPRTPRTDRAAERRGPFEVMSQLTREMDRVFDGFWRNPFGLVAEHGGRSGGGASALDWIPDLEMHEHDGEFVVRVDLPGMRKEDVDVEVVGQSLVIQGERRQGCESDADGWHHSECRYGSFVRSLPLPQAVDPEQIRASFQDGILELRMPAPDRTEGRRRIEIGEEPARGGRSAGRSASSRGGQDGPEST